MSKYKFQNVDVLSLLLIGMTLLYIRNNIFFLFSPTKKWGKRKKWIKGLEQAKVSNCHDKRSLAWQLLTEDALNPGAVIRIQILNMRYINPWNLMEIIFCNFMSYRLSMRLSFSLTTSDNSLLPPSFGEQLAIRALCFCFIT